ncbi:MAG: DegT/DnrJ/EryC1/StrS family aminotransferase [Acetobacteraceae bacterium]
MRPNAFSEPVYVTRPILPPLEDYHALLKEIWQRQWLSNNGEMVLALERELRATLRAPHLSVLGNGTLALQMAIRALGLGGEVITTPFTFPATAHALNWAGVTTIFADIDPVTLTLDPGAVARAITSRTSGILGVHVYGMPCDVHGLGRLAGQHGLKIIYDGAHAFGTEIAGRPIGDFGDATMLSFHATKLFHTAEGGALVLPREEDHAQVALLRNFGIASETTVLVPGVNAKMNELQAALGLLVLRAVPAERAARARIAAVYQARLDGVAGLRMLALPADVTHSRQYAVLIVDKDACGVSRDALYNGLKPFNIFARRYFYPLCSEAPHYLGLPSAAPENLPVAYRISRQVLALPYYGALDEEGAHRVCDALLYLLEH